MDNPDQYDYQQQQQQLAHQADISASGGNLAFEGTATNNFNSNDTNILQKKLLELQSELGMLDQEYD